VAEVGATATSSATVSGLEGLLELLAPQPVASNVVASAAGSRMRVRRVGSRNMRASRDRVAAASMRLYEPTPTLPESFGVGDQ
jgi:hypothetical protein